MSFPYALPMIIDGDGSCADITGEDPDNICCESIVLKDPGILINNKKSAVSGGATSILAPTGGIMHPRLEDLGLDDEFIGFNEKITEAARSCAGELPLGGVVHENIRIKESYGQNVFESAYFDHLESITEIKDAGADYILLENFDKLWDMRAGVLAAKNVGIPAFVVIRVDEEGKTESDTDMIAALITLQALGADAFGIECTAGAQDAARLIKRALPHAEIPLIFAGKLSELDDEMLRQLNENGVSVWIDRSDVYSKEKLGLAASFKVPFDSDAEKDSYAAATFREAFFLPENIEVSEPLQCGYDTSDELIDLDDSSCNAIFILLESTDDAASIADNAGMSYLPFVVHANDATTLEAALRYYQGRLLVDSQCDIDEEKLRELVKKYGAIIY